MNQKKTITIAKLTDLKSNYKKRSTSQIGKSIDSVTKVISRVCTWSYRKRERFLPCDLSRQRRQRRGRRRRRKWRKGRGLAPSSWEHLTAALGGFQWRLFVALTGWDSLSVVMVLTGSVVWMSYGGNEINDSYNWKSLTENNHQTKKKWIENGRKPYLNPKFENSTNIKFWEQKQKTMTKHTLS